MVLSQTKECPFSVPAKQDEVRTLDFDAQLDIMRTTGRYVPQGCRSVPCITASVGSRAVTKT